MNIIRTFYWKLFSIVIALVVANRSGAQNTCNPPSISLDIAPVSSSTQTYHTMTTINNNVVDPSETHEISLCNGHSLWIPSIRHSSMVNRYKVQLTPVSGGAVIFNYNYTEIDLEARIYNSFFMFTGFKLNLVNPSERGVALVTTTPYTDLNNNFVLDAGDCIGDPFMITFTINPNFTLIAKEEVHLHSSFVGGNIAVILPGKSAKIHENSVVRGSTQASVTDFDNTSYYLGLLNHSPATPELPPFIYNYEVSGTDVVVPDNYNGVYELTGNNFKKISIGKNSSLKFLSTGNVYIRELITKDNPNTSFTGIEFNGTTNLVIKKKMDLGTWTFLGNQNDIDNKIFVEEEDVHIGGASRIYAGIDVRFKNLIIDDIRPEWYNTQMIGQYIARKIDVKGHVDFEGLCENGYIYTFRNNREVVSSKDEPFEKPTINISPNPSQTDFRIKLSSSSDENYSIRVFDISGRMVQSMPKNSPGFPVSFGSELHSGIYFAEIKQGSSRQLIKLVKLD